jgi:hypothetical protein
MQPQALHPERLGGRFDLPSLFGPPGEGIKAPLTFRAQNRCLGRLKTHFAKSRLAAPSEIA